MELELKDYFSMIKRRLWLIAIIVVVITTVTGMYSYYLVQPVYQASTKLIVNQDNRTDGQVGSSLDYNTINMNLKLVDTYKEIIRTPAIMDVVAENYPDLHLNAEQLISRVQVSSTNGTQVMTLRVVDSSYQRAAQIANAVAVVFQEQIPSIMNVDNITILNKADESKHVGPISPNPKLNIAIGFVVSLMIGLGITFLLEYLDDTVKSEEDVQETLGLPMLAMISKMKQKDVESDHPVSKTVNEVGDKSYASAG